MVAHRLASSSDHEGQILVLTSVSMVALMGIMALSLDASFMFEKRNRLHAAADAAAKTAAVEITRNKSVTLAALESFADQQVSAHGFTPSRQGGTTSVVINRGPSGGTFAGNTNYVEAILSESTSTFFSRALGFLNMTPMATAIAGAWNPTACLITQDDLTIGNTSITLNGCGADVGGDLNGNNPNSRINGTPTPGVGVTGACVGTCGSMGSLTTTAPPPIDPFAGLAVPTDPGGCVVGSSAVLNPGCYTEIRDTVLTLLPGDYYIKGPVEISNLTGTNVMLFLTGAGRLHALNNKELHLSGRTTGLYTGMAIFQDSSNTNNFVTGNSFQLDVTGAIYMPGADVDFPNSLSFTATSCMLFVAKTLTIDNGSGSISNSGCASTFANAAFLTASIAR